MFKTLVTLLFLLFIVISASGKAIAQDHHTGAGSLPDSLTFTGNVGVGTSLPAKPVVVVPADQSVQYSDPLKFTEIKATSSASPISSLRFGASSLPSGLRLADKLDGSAAIEGNVLSAMGLFSPYIWVIDSINNLTGGTRMNITVIPEEGTVRYTGPGRFYANQALTLISQMTQAADGYLGDLRRAKVNFQLTGQSDALIQNIGVGVSANGSARVSLQNGLAEGIYKVQVVTSADSYFQASPSAAFKLIVSNPDAPLWPVQYAAASPWPGYSYALPYFQFWQKVKVQNKSSSVARNVRAYIVSVSANTQIVSGSVFLGDIPAKGSVWSSDAFTLKIDLRIPGQKCESFVWRIEYDDSSGAAHVLNNIPQYPPGLAPGGCL